MSEPSKANGLIEVAACESHRTPSHVGPVLHFRRCEGGRLELSALVIRPANEDPPLVTVGGEPIDPQVLRRRCGLAALRYVFALPSETGGCYAVDGETFDVAGIPAGDLRIGYVSCNGQEQGDRDRPLEERNAMWERLAAQHRQRPLNLLLHGGDQLYADEVRDVHPALDAWARSELSDEEDEAICGPAGELIGDFYFASYARLYSQPGPAWLHARVPSLCMWDDHDICDGWGSHTKERLDSCVGKTLFAAARESFLLFQLGCLADDLAPICLDHSGATLGWAAKLPGLLIVAPDLRSERRPDRVMGPAGWDAFERALDRPQEPRVFLMSSVPLLGPRLSWIEAAMLIVPGLQVYEDDLRDQWQSRWHREAWRRALRIVVEQHEQGTPVTVLSGEIHLATRATMRTRREPVHQLISSGIAHPPPTPWYGRALGALARLGDAPLPDHKIRMYPLPGQKRIYTSQRNYLMLERRDGEWSAWWELEKDRATPALRI